MHFRFNPALRIISSIVLAFFTWTFGGLFDIAYAIESQQNPASKKQQVAQQPAAAKTERPEEKFEKGIEDIIQHFDNIQKVQTDKERDDEKGKLKAKTQEINSLDSEIKKQFAETEKKLKDAKLPDEILQRHYNFVKSYEDNLSELNKNILALDKAKTKAEIDAEVLKVKPFFEKIKPPKKHQPLDPNNFPHRAPELKEYQLIEKKSEKPLLLKEAQDSERQPIQVATTGSMDGLLASAVSAPGTTRQASPTAADLAETMEIQLTPEIRAKAQELGNSPVKIYEWVKSTIDYEPYYGSLKGAQQTLAEFAGNDLDQAGLLIALLRAANIPARYVYGTIELPIDRLMNWIGVKDSMTATRILATNGIPGTLLTEGGQVKYAQFEHVWVEAYVDMFPSMGAIQRQASYWTPIDPSMKETGSSDSLNISKTVPFDETTYINTGDDMPPVLSYIYKLKDYYNTNYDYNFMKIFHVSVKKRQEFGILLGTLPYEVISDQRYPEIPDTKRHKIRLGLTSDGIDAVYVNKAYPEISGKKVTLSYTAATASDQAVIDRYGGLLHTPAYLISVKPEIKIDDLVILTGPVMGLGKALTLTTELTSPNMPIQRRDANITQGISYAIGLPALHYSGLQLVGQIDRMRVLEGTLQDSINAMDDRTGELLHNIAIEYFGQLNNTSRSIEGIMHVQNTKMPSIALISADATYTELFGMPVSPPIMKGLGIDAIRIASSPMPIDGDLNQRREFIKHRGLTSSYLEHKILENLLSVESISAVKALQTAAKNGVPIYTLDKNTMGSILPILTLPERDKTDIRNAVNAGKEVIVSRDNITLGDWTGVGYIARDPSTGSGVYMISNELGGGGTVQASNPKFDKEIRIAWFLSGRPIVGSKDDYTWWAVRGLTELLTVVPIWEHHSYIPATVLDADSAWVKFAANYDQTWIFYYSGHGWYDQHFEIDFLGPDDHNVLPTDIGKENEYPDVKIVFLNSCGSAHYGSFAGPFGVMDQKHSGSERKEVLVGFDMQSIEVFSQLFTLDFWMYFGIGLSVNEVVALMTAKALINIDLMNIYHLSNLKIIPLEGGATTIRP